MATPKSSPAQRQPIMRRFGSLSKGVGARRPRFPDDSEIAGRLRHSPGFATKSAAFRRFTFCLLVMVIGGELGCDRGTPASVPAQKIRPGTKVAFIGPFVPGNQPSAIAIGFESFLQAVPNITILNFEPASASTADLIEICRLAARQQPAGVAVYAETPEAAEAAVAMVHRPGVCIVTIGATLDNPRVFGQVRYNPSDSAQLLGAQLDQVLESGEGYILIHERSLLPYGRACYERFRAGAATFSSRRQLAETDFNSPADDSSDRISLAERVVRAAARYRSARAIVSLTPEPWLTSHPGSFDKLFKDQPDCRYATTSAAPALWDDLRTGRAIALAGPLESEMGRAAAEFMYRGLTGGRTPPALLVEPELVTLKNLDSFAQRHAAASGDANPTSMVSPPESGERR